MSIRRMMLFTLGGVFKSIISLFKTRVLNDGGTFEAETKLENQLNTLGSTLFDSASLVITPNGVKTSKLYTIKPNDGTGDLTVVRNTSATRINENGNIVNVPANVARIDYSNGSPAILVEPQRTNLVYPSDIATTQVRAVTAQVYTLSFYGTGTVTLSGAFSGSLVGTGTNNRVSLTFTPTAGNLTLTVSGTVTNWQLEAGSNATSLIKTISGSVTRNADVISKSGISSLIGQTEGTMYWEGSLSTNAMTIASLRTDSGIVNGVIFDIEADNRIRAYIVENNVQKNTIPSLSAITLNSFIKIAYVYKSGNCSLFINGVKQNTSSQAFTFNNTISKANIDYVGYNYGAFQGKTKYVKNCIVFPTILSDAQCISLTTL